MVCTTITIAAPDKKYECINNQCTESPTGTYINDLTCGGTCQAATTPDDWSKYVIPAAIGVAALILLRKD